MLLLLLGGSAPSDAGSFFVMAGHVYGRKLALDVEEPFLKPADGPVYILDAGAGIGTRSETMVRFGAYKVKSFVSDWSGEATLEVDNNYLEWLYRHYLDVTKDGQGFVEFGPTIHVMGVKLAASGQGSTTSRKEREYRAGMLASVGMRWRLLGKLGFQAMVSGGWVPKTKFMELDASNVRLLVGLG